MLIFLYFQDKNLIDKLENDMDQYTLFVPSDAYASRVNVTVVGKAPFQYKTIKHHLWSQPKCRWTMAGSISFLHVEP